MEKIGVQAVFEDAQFKRGIEGYNRSLASAGQQTEKAAGAMEKAKSPLDALKTAFAALGGAAVAMKIGQTALELATLGLSAEKARASFVAISGGAQLANDNLNAMRAATQGTLSDMDAMTAASKLMQMGLASNSTELGNVTEMAVRLGTAMGRDAGASIEEFSLLLANQSIPRLDTFGISAARVRLRIAELQEATPGLSRETAFMTAVMEQGAIAMQRLGDAGLGQVQNVDKLKASWSNLKVTVGEMLTPVLLKGADALNTSAKAAQLLLTWNDQLSAGYAEHEASVRKTSTSYEQYLTEMLRAAAVAGRESEVTGDLAEQMARQGASAAEIETALSSYSGTVAAATQYNLTFNGVLSATDWTALLDGQAAATQGYNDMGVGVAAAIESENALAAVTLAAVDPALTWSAAIMQDVASLQGLSQQAFVTMMIQQLSAAQQAGTISTEQMTAAQLALYEQTGLLTAGEKSAYEAINSLTGSLGAGTISAGTFASAVLSAKDTLDAIPKTVTVDFIYNIPAAPSLPHEAPVAFAAGGSRLVTRPTLFMAGERGVGPELVTATPLRGPVDNSRSYTVNLGGATINTRTDAAALAHSVARQIGRML